VDAKEDEVPNGNSGPALTTLCSINSSSNIASSNGQSHGYSPIAAKGHKDSVYALAMNDTGTLLLSGGTEKVLHSSRNIIRLKFCDDYKTSQQPVSVHLFP
jgi:WD repeat-containing protein 48